MSIFFSVASNNFFNEVEENKKITNKEYYALEKETIVYLDKILAETKDEILPESFFIQSTEFALKYAKMDKEHCEYLENARVGIPRAKLYALLSHPRVMSDMRCTDILNALKLCKNNVPYNFDMYIQGIEGSWGYRVKEGFGKDHIKIFSSILQNQNNWEGKLQDSLKYPNGYVEKLDFGLLVGKPEFCRVYLTAVLKALTHMPTELRTETFPARITAWFLNAKLFNNQYEYIYQETAHTFDKSSEKWIFELIARYNELNAEEKDMIEKYIPVNQIEERIILDVKKWIIPVIEGKASIMT